MADTHPAAGAFERGSAGASGGLSRGFGRACGAAPAAQAPRRGGRFGPFVRRLPPLREGAALFRSLFAGIRGSGPEQERGGGLLAVGVGCAACGPAVFQLCEGTRKREAGRVVGCPCARPGGGRLVGPVDAPRPAASELAAMRVGPAGPSGCPAGRSVPGVGGGPAW